MDILEILIFHGMGKFFICSLTDEHLQR